MNIIDNVYLLRMEWGYIKCLIKRYNLKFLKLPLLYLLVILLVIPKSTASVYTYEVSSKELDAYTTAINREDKVSYILEKYNLTDNQFNVLKAICLSEAETNSYEDAYAVINTIYNRTHSKNWVQAYGTSLYSQATANNQFIVYQNGSYKRYLNDNTSVGYEAIIDFLYEEEILHNYLSFNSHSSKVSNYETYSTNGNKYFNELQEENRV